MTKNNINKHLSQRLLLLLPVFSLILFLFLIVAVNGNKKTVNEVTIQNQAPTSTPYKKRAQDKKPIIEPSTKSGWVVYINNTYGYGIDIPAGSFLVQEDANYTRIQNYSFVNDPQGLKKKEYYLEIYKSDALQDTYFCKNDIVNPETIVVNNTTGYKGFLQRGGGESATIRYALCIQRDSINFNVVASEEGVFFSQKIVDSFRFTN